MKKKILAVVLGLTLCFGMTGCAKGDKFDFVAYDRAIIENGPLPFAILEGVVENYINENK